MNQPSASSSAKCNKRKMTKEEDEKLKEKRLLKRRTTCRINQQRHRQRQKDAVLALEEEVGKLSKDLESKIKMVETLQFSKKLIHDNLGIVRLRVITGLHKHLDNLHNSLNMSSLCCYAKDVFEPDVTIAHSEIHVNHGSQFLLRQLQLYTRLHGTFRIDTSSLVIVGGVDVVRATILISVRISVDTAMYVYPNLAEVANVASCINEWLQIPATVSYTFNNTSQVGGISIECNYFIAWKNFLGSSADASHVVANSNLIGNIYINEHAMQ